MSLPAEAKSNKKEPKVIGYEYKYVRMKVRIAKKKYLGKFYITHYCPCSKCCGAEGGKVTASGTKPTAGRTVGVNPNLISYGTKLKVGNTRGYIAEDTGGGIGWRHLDIFCNSHAEALKAGVGYKKVWAITYKYKKKKIKVRVPIYEEDVK
jgi:3D (Asp-Asp-Asp) domain-containing protein